MELQFEEPEASAGEDEIAADAGGSTNVAAFTRKQPVATRRSPRTCRASGVIPGPSTCPCCGGTRLRKLGETITETLEVIPRQWKVIQTVREKILWATG